MLIYFFNIILDFYVKKNTYLRTNIEADANYFTKNLLFIKPNPNS